MTHPAIQVPSLIAHRGYSAAAPENTLAAVRAAHQAGTTWVELDVQLLGDGTPIIWHDADVSRCSNGRGSLASMSWATAQTLDAGSWFGDHFAGEKMPSLGEMLALLNDLKMGVNMEIKVNRGRDPIALVERALPEMLDTLPPERLIISSFNTDALTHCRQFAGKERLALGVLYNGVPKTWRAQCEAIDAFSVHPSWSRLKRAQADAMQQEGYQVLCYTANDPSAFHSRWSWGIAGVITDEPAAFKRFLDSH